jgi:predicted component of type VI protein secretion system
MNYVLQVVRGRSATTTLKLADGVTSLGRHDGCVIRIKSSQVSRRHCELFEAGGKLTVRDLGSSNGTFVNGQRVSGQQTLTPGDELTVGAVTLRVVTLGTPAGAPQPAVPAHKPGDTAVVEAIPVGAGEDEEFEVAFDEGEVLPELDVIPLADQESPTLLEKPPAAKAAAARKATAAPADEKTVSQPAMKPKAEEEAVAQFLLDLNLDED